jgi:branched-chain amino acid transport system substrate-binding protein
MLRAILEFAKISLFLVAIPISKIKAEEQTINIGLLIPLSGAFANIGEDCQRGIEAARQEFITPECKNCQKIRFIYADSQADPKIAISEFSKLTEINKVSAVLTSRSTVGMALNPISKQKQIPLIGAVGHKNFRDNPFAFQFWTNTKEEGTALANKAIKEKQFSVALITMEDDWTLSISDEFKKAFTSKGGSLVFEETITSNETEFSSLVTKTKLKKPQAIFVNLGISQGGLLTKRIREQRLNQQIYSNFWSASPEAIDVAGKTIEGAIFVETSLELPKFKKALNDIFKDPKISAMTYSCYSGTAAIVSAVANLPSEVADKKEVYDSLLKIKLLNLKDEQLAIEDRYAKFRLAYKTIHNSKSKEIELCK